MSTEPTTISEALELLQDQQNQGQSPNGVISVDVMGVVLNHSITQSPPPWSNDGAVIPKADVYILDPTVMEETMSVRVTLLGTDEVARLSEHRLQTGDIVRFNQVSFSKASTTDHSIQFINSFSDPDPNFDWCRLGTVDSNGVWVAGKSRVPQNMICSSARISSLIEWFRRRQQTTSGTPRLDQAGADSAVADGTSTAISATTRLTPPPRADMTPTQGCQRLTLQEIHRLPIGVLSNILVKVVRYDRHVVQQAPISQATKRNRTRRATQPVPPPIPSVVVGFATLSDGSGVGISFVDTNGLYSTILQHAVDCNGSVMFTNVLSREQSDNVLSLTTTPPATAGEVVCVAPTNSSVAFLFSPENNLRVTTMSNPTVHPNIIESFPITHAEGNEISLISSIEKIFMDDTSSRMLDLNNYLGDASQFLEAVLSNRRDSYSWGYINLRACTTFAAWQQQQQRNVDGRRQEHESSTGIYIGPEMVQRLCGDISPLELCDDEAIRGYSFQLVSANLREQIAFRWTIDFGRQPATATDVVLAGPL